jgi:tRNA (mo5U34)-methyltransferase
VEEMELDVMEASPEKIGMFDVVLFAGVLYHLRHPLLALERVFSVTRKLLVLETHVDLTQVKRPVMAFYPKDEAGVDDTNWWGPNPSCVLEMLKSVGFKKFRVVSEIVSGDVPSIEGITYGRMVVHAEP